MQIKEGNKLIARFMAKNHDHYQLLVKTFKYHERWDYLIPVLERIGTLRLGLHDEALGADYPDNVYYAHVYTFRDKMVRIHCFSLHQADTLIEAAWQAVVEFIQWHNEQTEELKKFMRCKI